MAQGGEFAFVLYTTAAAAGIIDGPTNAIFTATVIISMALTPFAVMGLRFLPKPAPSMDGVELPDGLHERVLLIGFGRFGQIAAQPLFALRHRLSIIDNDTEMIQVAGRFGFKVYYGDGTRLDVLRAAGRDRGRHPHLHRRQGRGAKIARAGAQRVPDGQGDGPRLRPPARLRADQGRRRFPDSRSVRIRARVRGGDDQAAGAERGGGRRGHGAGPRRRPAALRGPAPGRVQAGRDLLLSNAAEQAREQGVAARRRAAAAALSRDAAGLRAPSPGLPISPQWVQECRSEGTATS